MKTKLILIVTLLFLLASCTNITSQSSPEEVCSAIGTDFLRDRCAAYVTENPKLCEGIGCAILARKLGDANICMDYGSYDGEKCKAFARLTDQELAEARSNILGKLIDPKIKTPDQSHLRNLDCSEGCIINESMYKYYTREEILSANTEEICYLEKQDCYGTCLVAQGECIKDVARVKQAPEICELMGNIALAQHVWKSDCYYELAIITNNIELCNQAQGLYQDECYFTLLADNLPYIYENWFVTG